MKPVIPALTIAVIVSLFGSPVAAAGVPPCSFGDAVIEYNGPAWASVVIDTWWRLPSTYVPADLVSVRGAHVAGTGKVRRLVIADLAAMTAAARASGVQFAVQSAFRSYGTQASTFRSWVSKIGLNRALKTSARAGHSEHQLGTVLDLKTPGQYLPWFNISAWARTPISRWLAANAWRYGFVMSYPKGLYPATCYAYEPWHYRYVGHDVAQAIHDSGQPPRVWLLTHPTPSPSPRPTPTALPTPTAEPSPTAEPTAEPTTEPTAQPTAEPTPEPTAEPTAEPTDEATGLPE